MIDAGVDVFASIAGGAAQGLIRAAGEKGAYVVFHNINQYGLAPGVIVGCGLMEQKKLTEEILAGVLAGTVEYGTSRTVGLREGYLDFIDDDPGYYNYLPQDIQERFKTLMDDLRSGRETYTVPPL
jgi:simple sugar transport system substrate-binding protein